MNYEVVQGTKKPHLSQLIYPMRVACRCCESVKLLYSMHFTFIELRGIILSRPSHRSYLPCWEHKRQGTTPTGVVLLNSLESDCWDLTPFII
jgi:hypothetical protein